MKLLLTLLSLISSEGSEYTAYSAPQYGGYRQGGYNNRQGGYNNPGLFGQRGFGGSYNGRQVYGSRRGSRRGVRRQNYNRGGYAGQKNRYASGRDRYAAQKNDQYNQGAFGKRNNRGYAAQFGGRNTQIGRRAHTRGYKNRGQGGRQQTKRHGQRGSRYARNDQHKKGLYKRGKQQKNNAGRTQAQNRNRNFGSRQGRRNVYQGQKKNKSNAQRGARNNFSRNAGRKKSKSINFENDDEQSYSKKKTKFNMDSSEDDYSNDIGNSDSYSAKNQDASDMRYGQDENNRMGFGSDKGAQYDSWRKDNQSQDTQYQMNDQGSNSARAGQFAGFGRNDKSSKYDQYAQMHDKGAAAKLNHKQQGARQYGFANNNQRGAFKNGRGGASVYKDRQAVGAASSGIQGYQASGAKLAAGQQFGAQQFGAQNYGQGGYRDY